MKQLTTQNEVSVQKNKLNWKKISIFLGAGTIVATSATLVSWEIINTKKVVKLNDSHEILEQSNKILELPELKYTKMNIQQFKDLHKTFYSIKNSYIKSIATEKLLFYLPSSIFKELEDETSSYDLTPNLEKILKEKMLNTVGSNLRVWGLNSGYKFDWDLSTIKTWNLVKDNNKINFEFDLGYQDSVEVFKLKGEFWDSEDKTTPIRDINQEQLKKIFVQAKELYSNKINRNGYFIGLNFNGEKDDSKNWLDDQTVNLQEFDAQVWDYVLNSFKNFNLVQEDVFVDGLELLDIDGWNPENIYVKDKTQVKVNEDKNEIWLGKVNDFGPHSIVSKIKVSVKTSEEINFDFTGSYLQNSQWGNY